MRLPSGRATNGLAAISVAVFLALIAASLLPPPPRDDRRTVLLSIADRDGKELAGFDELFLDVSEGKKRGTFRV